MKRIETSIPGLCLIEPVVHEDERGFFFESYNEQKFAEIGITTRFVQDNHSRSVKNTLRGMHYQLAHPQTKLCRVVQGTVLDAVVDIRHGSPYFGSHVATVLSAENRRQMYIPAGFAHGYVVLSETAEFLYKCSDFYRPGDDRGIAWDDPELGIAWNVSAPILSPKDRLHPFLSKVAPAELPVYAGDDGL
ncbi:MAG TPA: dTDP-4-dehydrorhamnose 3,5-epimerase [Blastocatellia bacterium]|nr:dTDP-4-dehydrorhamnose 3,5-epimerase [Blastocatellia bacterium]